LEESKSKPEPRYSNVSAVYFYSSAQIFESVARSLFTIKEQGIAKVG